MGRLNPESPAGRCLSLRGSAEDSRRSCDIALCSAARWGSEGGCAGLCPSPTSPATPQLPPGGLIRVSLTSEDPGPPGPAPFHPRVPTSSPRPAALHPDDPSLTPPQPEAPASTSRRTPGPGGLGSGAPVLPSHLLLPLAPSEPLAPHTSALLKPWWLLLPKTSGATAPHPAGVQAPLPACFSTAARALS